MSYTRVIPRDLFNESKLLKCLGRLWILSESQPRVQIDHDGSAFDIEQDAAGAISVSNVWIAIRGCQVHFSTALNSKEPWPMYATLENDEEIQVFTDAGEFTPEFAACL